jgi:hypothetical protein
MEGSNSLRGVPRLRKPLEQALSFELWGLRGGRGLPGAYGIALGIGESELCDQATAGTE